MKTIVISAVTSVLILGNIGFLIFMSLQGYHLTSKAYYFYYTWPFNGGRETPIAILFLLLSLIFGIVIGRILNKK